MPDFGKQLLAILGEIKGGGSFVCRGVNPPTLQVFDYQALQAKRTEMEHAIRNVTIDIKMETIRKGSPHSLRLTKIQDAYQKELTQWKKDVELLKKAEAW
jgi:hypothetical protein